MDYTLRGMFYLVGIIAVLYLLVKYIIPVIIKGLEILLSVVLWVAVSVLVVYIIIYLIKSFYEQY
ncbi:MAG: hypothetical protein N2316_08475 [Spirochaetes bacterium]|nr:hypothetical protein [Spirochaetota bacterium]